MKFFTVLTISFAIAFGLTACKTSEVTPEIQANEYAEEVRRHRDFSAIKAGKSVNLEIVASDDFSVIVRSPDSGFSDIKTEVEGDMLVITSKSGRKGTSLPITVLVTMPELARLDLWGSSRATVKNVKGENLTLLAGGDSVLTIEGETSIVKMVATGVGRINAAKLKSGKCEVKATGASEVTVWAIDELSGEAHGASKIFYDVEPKRMLQSLVGAGQIVKK